MSRKKNWSYIYYFRHTYHQLHILLNRGILGIGWTWLTQILWLIKFGFKKWPLKTNCKVNQNGILSIKNYSPNMFCEICLTLTHLSLKQVVFGVFFFNILDKSNSEILQRGKYKEIYSEVKRWQWVKFMFQGKSAQFLFNKSLANHNLLNKNSSSFLRLSTW